jgi:hypothetical protein
MVLLQARALGTPELGARDAVDLCWWDMGTRREQHDPCDSEALMTDMKFVFKGRIPLSAFLPGPLDPHSFVRRLELERRKMVEDGKRYFGERGLTGLLDFTRAEEPVHRYEQCETCRLAIEAGARL